jgi:hypothetical protein
MDVFWTLPPVSRQVRTLSLQLRKHILTALVQDHHRPCSHSVGCMLWWHYQPRPIHLLQALRLHNEDLAATVAPGHGVSHHESQVRNHT